jgi:hypothetical protein
LISGTVNALPTSGGIIATITLPVTGNYIMLVTLNFGQAGPTNSLYINVNSASGTFYGTSGTIVAGGFLAINATLFFANTGSNVYNIYLTYNGSPILANNNTITAMRIA